MSYVYLWYRHLKCVHDAVHKQYVESVHLGSAAASQTPITSFLKDHDQKCYGPQNPRQKHLTNLLVTNFVRLGLPISVVDSPHFCEFLSELDPKYQPPCRQTVTPSILADVLQSIQSKLHSHLAKSQIYPLHVIYGQTGDVTLI